MVVLFVLTIAYVSLCLLHWLWSVVGVVRVGWSVERLGALCTPDPPRWPRLSVIVPACNEADKITPALRTLIEQDYPDLELIVVDDRSTDCTGEIIDRLASESRRVRAIHVTTLPEGWLGKVHALHCGLAESTGEFVMFTDADVHFRADALRKSIAYCLDRGLDYLAALPDIWPGNVVCDTMVAMFLRSFILFLVRPWAVSNPRSKAFVGIGAFNLVRREVFETTEGFEWLRLEIGDDMGVGFLMKRSGARCGVAAGFDLVGLHWHRTIAEAARGAEKGWAPVCRFSVLRGAALATGSLLVEMSPLLAVLPLIFAPIRLAGYLGLGVVGAWLATVLLLVRWVGPTALRGLLGPLVAPLMSLLILRTALLGRRRGGVLWRGTLYPSETLRAGMRLRLSLRHPPDPRHEHFRQPVL
ncbi:MAG: glycosyltransferase family 2 protein [Planctomycetota bacterium]|nr:glycosyltransferase family 2 protein [Planctomycetota bacterium]